MFILYCHPWNNQQQLVLLFKKNAFYTFKIWSRQNHYTEEVSDDPKTNNGEGDQ